MNSNRVMFLRNDYNRKTNPVGCVAINLTSGTSSDNCCRLSYQVSVLNPSDRFVRPVARQLALGRLVEKPIVLGYVDPNINMTDVTEKVMVHIANNVSLPKRARLAAVAWFGYSRLNDFLQDQASGAFED